MNRINKVTMDGEMGNEQKTLQDLNKVGFALPVSSYYSANFRQIDFSGTLFGRFFLSNFSISGNVFTGLLHIHIHIFNEKVK